MVEMFGFTCLSCEEHFKGRCYLVVIEFVNKETQKPEWGFRRFCNKCGMKYNLHKYKDKELVKKGVAMLKMKGYV